MFSSCCNGLEHQEHPGQCSALNTNSHLISPALFVDDIHQLMPKPWLSTICNNFIKLRLCQNCCLQLNLLYVLLVVTGTMPRAFLSGYVFFPVVSSSVHAAQEENIFIKKMVKWIAKKKKKEAICMKIVFPCT